MTRRHTLHNKEYAADNMIQPCTASKEYPLAQASLPVVIQQESIAVVFFSHPIQVCEIQWGASRGSCKYYQQKVRLTSPEHAFDRMNYMDEQHLRLKR